MSTTSESLSSELTSTTTPPLFQPFTLRDLTLRNRLMVSPMCQYSSEDGFANDWHLVHLGSFATGGAAIVMTEATAVEARGRISPQDLGVYRDEHIPQLARITHFLKEQGASPAIQLAHAGRKASTYRPWSGQGEVTVEDGRWQTVGPSALRMANGYPLPHVLTPEEIQGIIASFTLGAERALQAGFEIAEIHAAHGYLLHQFISPLSNKREDQYGGSLANRMRFLLEVTDAVRQIWPAHLPLFVRLSASDWTEGGVTIDDTVEISRALKAHGVDLVDTSSGGITLAPIPVEPGYQVSFAERIRREVDLPTAAVGLITEAQQANTIIQSGQADVIALGREFLRNPHWPLQAAHELGYDLAWARQYERAKLPLK